MVIWISSIIFYFPALCASDIATYECGSHGKFEYCIDGIPGCVIGCHCHPGYYFDTESKICEPNTKLAQDYRRHYLAEPTRVHVQPTRVASTENPDRTTKDAVDKKLDEIANDADDLGDWLYNQFFKTIENQVINKTKEENLLTRRSGGGRVKKPVRRSKKRSRTKRKKHKNKNGLRNKLLEITEDDSLFDSTSGDTSGESSSSQSTSSEGTSKSSEGSVTSSSSKKKSNGHGHKKIVIFNKKPRPPLPSFIFLPNMDTPFYPPIGIPPPPVMPMYPMIPVPPAMVPPMFPYPAPASNGESASSTPHAEILTNGVTNGATTHKVSTIEESTHEDVATTPKESTEPVISEAEKETIETPETETPNQLRKLKSRSKPMAFNFDTKDVQQRPRNKLMQKLRQKMMRKNKLEKYFAEQYRDPESPMDVNLPPDFIPPFDSVKQNFIEKPPPVPDVDFKYLTELIHRIDTNKTSNNLMNQQNKPNLLQPINNYPETINSYYEQPVVNQDENLYPIFNNTRRFVPKQDDFYYAKLGRQIASMIKNVDPIGQEVNIEIEQSHQITPGHPIFNENSYGSRSYWERSVRSPMLQLKSLKKENVILRHSNEHLYNLENQVEFAASTVRTLSLPELESIISKMKEAQNKLNSQKRKTNKGMMTPSKVSFNINLLPKNDLNFHKEPTRAVTPQVQSSNWRRQNLHPVISTNPRSEYMRLQRFMQIPNRDSENDTYQDIRPPLQISKFQNKPNNDLYQTYNITNSYSLSNRENNTKQQNVYNSPLLDHNGYTYYPSNNNNNRYILFKKPTIPLHSQNYAKSLTPVVKKINPSYFFDYFD